MTIRARTRKRTTRRPKSGYWSADVTRRSNALDLDSGVFTLGSARAIASSLKRSAERSRRRKAGAYQSAMSMLSFYANRAGRNLGPRQKARLQRAKQELRKLFGRERSPAGRPRRRARTERPKRS
jgi:hypothetical protein